MQSEKINNMIFLGTIEKIEPSPIQESTLNWVIKCKVDLIIFGKFVDDTFFFRVHSPAKSGLEIGKQYKIEARETEDGFMVDPYQWRE